MTYPVVEVMVVRVGGWDKELDGSLGLDEGDLFTSNLLRFLGGGRLSCGSIYCYTRIDEIPQ